MKNYEVAELVELGTAAELVLGGFDEPPDCVTGGSLCNPAAVEAPE